MLIRPASWNGRQSPEIDGMIQMWRKLKDEARALRAVNNWRIAPQMAVQAAAA